MKKLLYAATAIEQGELEVPSFCGVISESRFLMIAFEVFSLVLEGKKSGAPRLWLEESERNIDIYVSGYLPRSHSQFSFSLTELLLRALGADVCRIIDQIIHTAML